MQAINEVGDRLDGKCAQTIERGEVSAEMLTDRELFAIIREQQFGPIDETNRPLISPPLAAK